MKKNAKKSLDSLIAKEIKNTNQVKGGGGLGESCYIIVNGQKIYC